VLRKFRWWRARASSSASLCRSAGSCSRMQRTRWHARISRRPKSHSMLARLSSKAVRIQIFTVVDGKCQMTREVLYPPCAQVISLKKGQTRTVFAQVGITTKVTACPLEVFIAPQGDYKYRMRLSRYFYLALPLLRYCLRLKPMSRNDRRLCRLMGTTRFAASIYH